MAPGNRTVLDYLSIPSADLGNVKVFTIAEGNVDAINRYRLDGLFDLYGVLESRGWRPKKSAVP